MTKLYDVDRVRRGDAGNSHSIILDLVGPDRRVLDVGCATGYLARSLVDNGCTVLGIDNDVEAIGRADDVLERGIVADLNSVDLTTEVGVEAVDVVVFGDVLEHLQAPVMLLRQAARVLRPGGYLVCSIPNVAHGDVRLALLGGHWDYRDRGLLDDTHLRFFTEDTFRALLREAGFAAVETRRIRVPLFHSEIGVQESDISPEVVAAVRATPDHDVYQIVLRAVPDDATGAVTLLAEREHALGFRVAELERELTGRSAQLAAARSQLAEVDRQLATTAEQIPVLHAQLAAAAALNEELQALKATKTLRWTSGLRTVVARARARA